MNQGFENQTAQILQPSATDSPRIALAKSMAKLVAGQHGAEAAAPAIEHARNLSLGISGPSSRSEITTAAKCARRDAALGERSAGQRSLNSYRRLENGDTTTRLAHGPG
jgi:hypothetical protein